MSRSRVLTDLEQAIQEGVLHNWQGNDQADKAAKEAAIAGERETILDDIQTFRTKASTLIKGVLDMVAAFPRITPPLVARAKDAEDGATPA